MSAAFEPGVVYLVESAEDASVLLAIAPKLTDRGVEWFDSVRDRGFAVEASQVEENTLVVRTVRATYRFQPLTLDLYRQRVKHRVSQGPDFVTTDELQRYYRAL